MICLLLSVVTFLCIVARLFIIVSIICGDPLLLAQVGYIVGIICVFYHMSYVDLKHQLIQNEKKN